jgi:hypothetical protein
MKQFAVVMVGLFVASSLERPSGNRIGQDGPSGSSEHIGISPGSGIHESTQPRRIDGLVIINERDPIGWWIELECFLECSVACHRDAGALLKDMRAFHSSPRQRGACLVILDDEDREWDRAVTIWRD